MAVMSKRHQIDRRVVAHSRRCGQ